VGYKGEIVNIPREVAYTELLPAQLALYPTPENIALFEEERKLLVDRPQISPFVMKCRDYLKSIVLQIPINLKLKEWSLTKDNIRIALRRVVCFLSFFLF
jgi:ribosomal protein L9